MKTKLLILSSALFLSGCLSTLPKWPDRAKGLDELCPELKQVKEGTTKLSDVLDVINENYAEYHKCKIRVELWNKWYKEQKENYEKIDEDD